MFSATTTARVLTQSLSPSHSRSHLKMGLHEDIRGVTWDPPRWPLIAQDRSGALARKELGPGGTCEDESWTAGLEHK